MKTIQFKKLFLTLFMVINICMPTITSTYHAKELINTILSIAQYAARRPIVASLAPLTLKISEQTTCNPLVMYAVGALLIGGSFYLTAHYKNIRLREEQECIARQEAEQKAENHALEQAEKKITLLTKQLTAEQQVKKLAEHKLADQDAQIRTLAEALNDCESLISELEVLEIQHENRLAAEQAEQAVRLDHNMTEYEHLLERTIDTQKYISTVKKPRETDNLQTTRLLFDQTIDECQREFTSIRHENISINGSNQSDSENNVSEEDEAGAPPE